MIFLLHRKSVEFDPTRSLRVKTPSSQAQGGELPLAGIAASTRREQAAANVLQTPTRSVILDLQDLIAAVATPAGPSGRSVIRLSGESVIATLRPRFQTDVNTWDQSRSSRRYPGVYQIEGWRSRSRSISGCGPTHAQLHRATPAELHLVGSPPVVDGTSGTALSRWSPTGRAGEFTLRAPSGGRVDLVQAEAVLGVIDATDDAQHADGTVPTGRRSFETDRGGPRVAAARSG